MHNALWSLRKCDKQSASLWHGKLLLSPAGSKIQPEPLPGITTEAKKVAAVSYYVR